ncbi:MAG: hypothetical protein DWH99_00915 [Planctomycetota bacterium]|nr:MAG: hypothetical protein DWH99_00915 [Planctomycetota bacterium]
MRLVPGTLVSPSVGMLAKESGDASGARHLGESPCGNASKRIGGLVGKASELRLQGRFLVDLEVRADYPTINPGIFLTIQDLLKFSFWIE